MSFSHLYYTCAKGDYHGFQVLAKSPAITADLEEDRIVKVSAYNLPKSIKRQEQEMDILALAPRKYAFYRLKSGRFALTNVTYSGKDYSERTGNFFADTIVFDKNSLKGKGRPIDYYGSPSFRQSITEAEVLSNTGVLEDVPMLEKGAAATFEAIQQFLSIPGHLDLYQSMLQAVIDYPKTKKSLIIVDETENVAQWIAAIQYSVPEALSWSISFTTYTHQYTFDHPDAVIFGVYKDEDVSPSWQSQFHVVDVPKQSSSFIEVKAYTQAIANAIQGSLQSYEQFISFVDLVGSNVVGEQLDSIIPLYDFIHGNLEETPEYQLTKGLERYLEIEDSTTLNILADPILKKIAVDENDCYQLYSKLPVLLVQQLIFKWMEIGKGHLGMKDLAVQFFYTSWESMLIDDRTDSNVKGLHQFADEIIHLNKGNAPFHKKGYEKARLDLLFSSLKEEGRQSLWDTWIKYVLIHLAENGIEIEQANDQINWLYVMLEYGQQMAFDFTNVFEIFFSSKEKEMVQLVLGVYLDGLHSFNETESLHSILNKLAAYIKKSPANEQVYGQLIANKKFVAEYFIEQSFDQVVESKTPISELSKIIEGTLKLIRVSEDDKDTLVGDAANRLLEQNVEPAYYFEQLKILVSMRDEELDWSRRLAPETTISLLEQGIHYLLVSTDNAENYKAVRSLATFLKEYHSPRAAAIKANYALTEQLFEMTIEQRLDSAAISKLMHLVNGKEREQVLEILRLRLPFFADRMSLSIMQSHPFYAAILPELEEQYVTQLMLSYEKSHKLQSLASYLAFKVSQKSALPEELVAYLQEHKKLMKDLAEVFGAARLKDTYEILKTQVQGNTMLAELSSKVSGLFKFKAKKGQGEKE